VTKAKELPDYENPPVIEVVCGIQFHALAGLSAPQLGLYWERLKPQYPVCKEMPPLTIVMERYEGEPDEQEIQLTNVPPMPRYWFMHEEQNGIVQVQRDRFLHNWKKVKPEDEYPKYDEVIKLFRMHLDAFEIFLRDSAIGGIQARQYEMTYVNHIPKGEGWNELKDIGDIFPVFASPTCVGASFLPTPESLNLRASVRMPEDQGRLHVTLSEGMAGNKSVLNLNLTARGIPKDNSRNAMWEWFDLAHTWIVHGFTDITSDKQQKTVWKRRQ
jgi:uncharacterized protein (TIGR04255 family)